MRNNNKSGYQPVRFDIESSLTEAMNNPEFAEAWNAPDPEIEALDVVLKARKAAGITQEEIARRMHTSQAAVARIEKLASNDAKHSPSVDSLKRYAAALGLKLKIGFEPARKPVKRTA